MSGRGAGTGDARSTRQLGAEPGPINASRRIALPPYALPKCRATFVIVPLLPAPLPKSSACIHGYSVASGGPRELFPVELWKNFPIAPSADLLPLRVANQQLASTLGG